jgi:hypothetical protein
VFFENVSLGLLYIAKNPERGSGTFPLKRENKHHIIR